MPRAAQYAVHGGVRQAGQRLVGRHRDGELVVGLPDEHRARTGLTIDGYGELGRDAVVGIQGLCAVAVARQVLDRRGEYLDEGLLISVKLVPQGQEHHVPRLVVGGGGGGEAGAWHA